MSNILTPIEYKNNYFFKRDDYFKYAGVKGGKVRTAKLLCEKASKGLVTAGSKKSPQIIIISNIAEKLNLPFIGHTPSGELSEELKKLSINKNTKIIQHKYGYNNVIIKRAKDCAFEKNYTYIPFGMECKEAINETSLQVKSILKYKNNIERIICPIGSGMSFLGIIKGMLKYKIDIFLIGIQVGSSPFKRFKKFSNNFFNEIKYKIYKSNLKYDTYVKDNNFCGIDLDPIYEAKCIPFLKKNDLLWIVGNRY